MLIHRYVSVFALISVLLLANLTVGCFSSDNKSFEFPLELEGTVPVLEIGDKWIHKGPIDGVTYTMMDEVIGEDIVEDKDCYIMISVLNPPFMGACESVSTIEKSTMDTITFQISGEYDETLLNTVRSYSYEYSEPDYPRYVGKKWQVTETETSATVVEDEIYGETEITVFEYEVEAIEEITLAAGSFRCFKVNKYDDTGSILTTSWYSDLVKGYKVKQIDHETDETMELVGYSVTHSGTLVSGGSVRGIAGSCATEYTAEYLPEILTGNPTITEVETVFDTFMQAARTKNTDGALNVCHEELFQEKSDLEFLIEAYYSAYFEDYTHIEVIDSHIGEIDNFTGEMNPEFRDKRNAVLRGYVNYSSDRKCYFEFRALEIDDNWKLSNFRIVEDDSTESPLYSSEEPYPGESIGLAINNIRLCSDVRDGSHYTLNPEKEYLQGQVVYLLFDAYGLTSREIGNQSAIHLQISQATMYDSEGTEVWSYPEPLDIRETYIGGVQDYLPVWLNFATPLMASAGNYSVEIELTDMWSGEREVARASFVIKESTITIDNINLCSEVTGFGEFTIQPHSTYAAGEKVIIYVEFPGIEVCEIEGNSSILVKVPELKLYDPQGDVALEINDLVSESAQYTDELSATPYLSFWVSTSIDFLPGEYSVEFTIEDGCTGDSVKETVYFLVDDSTPEDILET